MSDLAFYAGAGAMLLFAVLVGQVWASPERQRAYGRFALGCAMCWAGFIVFISVLYRAGYLTPTETLNLRSFPALIIDAALLLWAVNWRRWTRV